MNFTKMHGLGNDFVVITADTWGEADTMQSFARLICDRHFGVGADGLVVIGHNDKTDVFMRIFNPDGSEPEMCGNAIRCAARYAYENKWVDKPAMSIQTLAGPRYPVVNFVNGAIEAVTVDMGEPITSRPLIPVAGKGDITNIKIQTKTNHFAATVISMGNPHCIVFVNDIEQTPVYLWGPEIENHPMFPAKTNVEFVQVVSRRELVMRVWERGAGVTMACGTGACATLAAAVLNGHTDRQAVVHLLGGDLNIEWNATDNHVYMTGPATEVFKGNLKLG